MGNGCAELLTIMKPPEPAGWALGGVALLGGDVGAARDEGAAGPLPEGGGAPGRAAGRVGLVVEELGDRDVAAGLDVADRNERNVQHRVALELRRQRPEQVQVADGVVEHKDAL